jgi:hypothetical protein
VIPSSPLAGLLIGLLDGLIVTAIILLGVLLDGRRRRWRHPEPVRVETVPSAAHTPAESDRVPHAA